MKACSFLPAATQMIYDMGLQEYLYGITFECPETALAEKQKVVRYVLEGNQYSSAEIDKIFSASKAQGKSMYYVEEDILKQIAPDIIFTQDVCEVCQIDTACTATAVAKLSKQPQLIPLSPKNLNDVYESAIIIAKALGKEEAGYHYLSSLQNRTDNILDALSKNKMPLKTVSLLEWMEPIYNCGHWIPYQIAQAGGVDMLGNPSGDSRVVSWQRILKYDPEVIIIAPCGFTATRTMQELHLLTEKEGWHQLKAVDNNQVFVVDFTFFTQPSASTLVDGIELLSALLHPDLFTLPAKYTGKVKQILHSNTPAYQ